MRSSLHSRRRFQESASNPSQITSRQGLWGSGPIGFLPPGARHHLPGVKGIVKLLERGAERAMPAQKHLLPSEENPCSIGLSDEQSLQVVQLPFHVRQTLHELGQRCLRSRPGHRECHYLWSSENVFLSSSRETDEIQRQRDRTAPSRTSTRSTRPCWAKTKSCRRNVLL